MGCVAVQIVGHENARHVVHGANSSAGDASTVIIKEIAYSAVQVRIDRQSPVSKIVPRSRAF